MISKHLNGTCVAFAVAFAASRCRASRAGRGITHRRHRATITKSARHGRRLNMYLRRIRRSRARVKLIIEDLTGRPDTAVTKAKKLILSDWVHDRRRRWRPKATLAPVSTNDKTVTFRRFGWPTISPSDCRSIPS